MSDSAVASALWPTSAGECVASSKCTPSTTVSIDVTATASARTTAASSPGPLSTRGGSGPSAAWIAAISSSSAAAIASVSLVDPRNADRQHPARQREGCNREPAVGGKRDERQQPEQVPGDQPSGCDEDGNGRPCGHSDRV